MICQGGGRKDGSQLCHSCANYSKMNGIRPSTGGGAGTGAGATVRSPPAKIKVSSSGVRGTIIIIINIILIMMMMIFSTIITITIIMMIFAEREPQDGDDLRQLPDQHHHAVEEERPGGTSLQRVRPLLQAPRGEEAE